jgi:hypothetical protein
VKVKTSRKGHVYPVYPPGKFSKKNEKVLSEVVE